MKKSKLINKTELPPRYDEWLCFLFDRPESDKPWIYDFPCDEFKATNKELFELFIYTFIHCGKYFEKYSDAQLSNGLKYIFDSGFSNISRDIMSNDIPLKLKLQAISSINFLYADCFEQRCAPVLSHCDQKGSPLNAICYMLWDITPLNYWEGVDDCERETFYDAIVAVLEAALTLKNPACHESALHGLGHMLTYHKARISDVFTTYLRRNSSISPQLKIYAEHASTGYIQ